MIRGLLLVATLSLALRITESSASTTTTLQGPLLDQILSHRFAVRSPSSARRSSSIPRPQPQCSSAIEFLTPRPSPPRGGATAQVVRTITATQKELLNLLSGGVAGTVAACLTNPLEVVKTQLQASTTAVTKSHPMTVAKQILHVDGPAGFFRGLAPTLIGIIPSRSAYFYAYQRSKEALSPLFPEGSPLNALFSGLMAGITGNTLTNPIWMVRTRMQILADASAGQKAYTSYGDVIATVFREEGVRGFYKGISASYWGCLEGSMQFILYEQFKTRLLKRTNAGRKERGLGPTTELSPTTYFWSAALAKMIASIGTYPHEVARTRMREQARAGIFKYKGMWQTIGVVAREEGTKELYSGMGVHLMKVVPNSAFMFFTYEVVRRWLSDFKVENKNKGRRR